MRRDHLCLAYPQLRTEAVTALQGVAIRLEVQCRQEEASAQEARHLHHSEVAEDMLLEAEVAMIQHHPVVRRTL